MVNVPPSPEIGRWKQTVPVLVGIAFVGACTVMLFVHTLRYGFLDLDDGIYVLGNTRILSLSEAAIGRMFKEAYYRAYTPLTLLSHAVDWALWDADASGHHLTNVILHASNAILLFLLMLRVLARWPHEGDRGSMRLPDSVIWIGALIGAMLWSIHPLRVESVSWISDRKDILSGIFYLGTVHAYLCWADEARVQKWKWYLLGLVLYICAVLAKGTSFSAVLVLVVLDFFLFPRSWKNRWRDLLVAKLPYVFVALLIAVIGANSAPAVNMPRAFTSLSAVHACLLPLYSIVFYVGKSIVPWPLIPYYSIPPLSMAVCSGVLVVLLGISLVIAWKRGAMWWLMFWCTYLAMLVPVIAPHMFAAQPWADRYSYLPMMLPSGVLGGYAATKILSLGKHRFGFRLVCILVGLACVALATLSYVQEMWWESPESLWSHQLAWNNSEPTALNGMALVHIQRGELLEARKLIRKALDIEPGRVDIFLNLSMTCRTPADSEAVITTLRNIRPLLPGNGNVRLCLGNMFADRGDLDSAICLFREAMAVDSSTSVIAWTSLGLLHHRLGLEDSAAVMLLRALTINPMAASAWYDLSLVFRALGRTEETVGCLKRAADLGWPQAKKELQMLQGKPE